MPDYKSAWNVFLNEQVKKLYVHGYIKPEQAFRTLSEWEVFDLRFQINESADDYRWEFFEDSAPKKLSAKIYIEFDRSRALIPVPAELIEIRQLPAKFLKSSANGTIQATGLA